MNVCEVDRFLIHKCEFVNGKASIDDDQSIVSKNETMAFVIWLELADEYFQSAHWASWFTL